jgi:hypothetical protein
MRELEARLSGRAAPSSWSQSAKHVANMVGQTVITGMALALGNLLITFLWGKATGRIGPGSITPPSPLTAETTLTDPLTKQSQVTTVTFTPKQESITGADVASHVGAATAAGGASTGSL